MTPRPARTPLRAAVVLHVHGLERAADRAGAAPDNYPPYDLLRVTEPAGGGLRLVFAVAGFAPEQLEIFVTGDQLTVSGEGTGDGDPGRFLHRGIAARRFRRAFRLAPGLDVVGAELDRGLLTIALAQRAVGCADGSVAIRPRST
ncbi:Hsp20 family protein [Lichenibacterium dinghuense]|uniref:Hsp20 family protein n=1 Tax=Lichenibacterium dinghuense TaxID=2895977 RepID=UPI001F4595D3|nr:Hsp20 family protein [Lichenibacterium sp. 6Y81]